MLARLALVCAWVFALSACGTIKNNNNKGGADANPDAGSASTSCVLGSSAIGQCTLG